MLKSRSKAVTNREDIGNDTGSGPHSSEPNTKSQSNQRTSYHGEEDEQSSDDEEEKQRGSSDELETRIADQLSSVSAENIEKFLESYQYLVEKGIIANLGKISA